MENKMLDVEKRVRRYWYEDGIVEIAIGGMFTVLGLFFGLQGYFGEDSAAGIALAVSMVLAMMGGIFGIRWLVNTLKSRFTYPRTGYVEYRAGDKGGNEHRYFVITLVLVCTIALIVIPSHLRGLDSMVLATGMMLGVAFIVVRGKSSAGLIRFYILGGFSLLLGVGLSLSSLSRVYSLGLLFSLLGSMMIVTGLIVLRNYLRNNPTPANEEHDNE